MDHNTCESLIDDYIEDRLSGKTLDSFIKHVEECPKCFEELSINYSLINALKQIDMGKDLSADYDIELDEKIFRYKQKKKHNLSLRIFTAVFVFVISFALTIVISLFTIKEDIKYSKKESATRIDFKIAATDEEFDPVETTINKYNVDIINYLHKIQSNKSE